MFEAKIFTNGMNDDARKVTRSHYDETIAKLKLCHQAIFPLTKLRKKMLRAEADMEDIERKGKSSASSKQEGQKKKRKDKGKGKGKGQSSSTISEKDEEEEDALDEQVSSSGEGSDSEEIGHNKTALEYIDMSLDKQRKLDKKLRERLEILYVALSTNWKYGKKAETLQQGDKGKTLLERTVKAMNEQSKGKRDEDDAPYKRRKLTYHGEDYQFRGRGNRGGRGSYGSRSSNHPYYGSRGNYGNYNPQGGHIFSPSSSRGGNFGESYR
jgi:hypothetical protein